MRSRALSGRTDWSPKTFLERIIYSARTSPVPAHVVFISRTGQRSVRPSSRLSYEIENRRRRHDRLLNDNDNDKRMKSFVKDSLKILSPSQKLFKTYLGNVWEIIFKHRYSACILTLWLASNSRNVRLLKVMSLKLNIFCTTTFRDRSSPYTPM